RGLHLPPPMQARGLHLPPPMQARGLHLPPPRRAGGPLVVADMGTGSGALALAMAAELPEAEVWATDRSAAALDVARANLAAVDPSGAFRVHFAEGMWYEA